MSEGMKAAKATPADVDEMRDFLFKLEEMVSDLEEYDAGDIGDFCYAHFSAQCGRHFQRVLFGYDTLVDNACDPTLSHLDWKPEIEEAITAFQQLHAPDGAFCAHSWAYPPEVCPACNKPVPFNPRRR